MQQNNLQFQHKDHLNDNELNDAALHCSLRLAPQYSTFTLVLVSYVSMAYACMYIALNYSGTLLNEHPSTADTHDITGNSETPNCFSIDFNTLETPE